MTSISELMTPLPVRVQGTTPVSTCALRMDRLKIRHLPVIDEDGRLTGMVTDAAVHRIGAVFGTEYVPYEAQDEDRVCRTVALPVDVVVRDDVPLHEVVRRVISTRQDFAVVVDEQRHPVGIVTEHDLLKVALELLSDSEATVEALPPRLLVSLDQDAPAAWALDAMNRLGTRHMTITDRRGRLVGVVSLRDLIADDAGRREISVAEVLRAARPHTAPWGATLAECTRRMLELKIGCLPVVIDDRAIRVVSRRDVIEAALFLSEPEGSEPGITGL